MSSVVFRSGKDSQSSDVRYLFLYCGRLHHGALLCTSFAVYVVAVRTVGAVVTGSPPHVAAVVRWCARQRVLQCRRRRVAVGEHGCRDASGESGRSAGLHRLRARGGVEASWPAAVQRGDIGAGSSGRRDRTAVVQRRRGRCRADRGDGTVVQ